MERKYRRQWRDYKTSAGGRPVHSFIAKLTDEEAASIIAAMDEVQEQGLSAARHLRNDIYEVRADAASRSFRLLFATEGRYNQVLLALSAYEKRTQKIPKSELELAEKRLADWRECGRRRKR